MQYAVFLVSLLCQPLFRNDVSSCYRANKSIQSILYVNIHFRKLYYAQQKHVD